MDNTTGVSHPAPAIRFRGRRGATAVPNWRWEDPELDPYELRIAGWLASHESHYLADHVTRNEIAKRTGMSGGKVTKAMARLVELGIVELGYAPSSRRGRERWVITFDLDVWERPPVMATVSEKRSPDDRLAVTTRPLSGHVVTTTKDVQGEEHQLRVFTDAESSPRRGIQGEGDEASREEKKPKPRRRDDLFDALASACGYRYDEMTESQKKAVAVMKNELARVGATPVEVHRRAAAYRRKFPGAALTERALAKHWSGLDDAAGDGEAVENEAEQWSRKTAAWARKVKAEEEER